jgi:hypothetical protein
LSRLRIFPIVEGHGDDKAIRILLQRIWGELLGGEYVEVLKPFRGKRLKLVKSGELARVLNAAMQKLQPSDSKDRSLILILLDADDDPPCILGPEFLSLARTARSDADVSCVIANVEYETWFVAAAESLSDFLDLSGGRALAVDPEQARQGKAWIQKRYRGLKYSETIDQPAMTKAMDLTLCRQRSPSFDKLCRELEARLERSTHDHPS